MVALLTIATLSKSHNMADFSGKIGYLIRPSCCCFVVASLNLGQGNLVVGQAAGDLALKHESRILGHPTLYVVSP